MLVTHGHESDRNRRSDVAQHARSGCPRIAARIKKRACCDIASHASRLMAVCNDYLRVGVVPAESHLVFEKERRTSFFCKSRVSTRYRTVATIGNDVKHLLVTVGVNPGTPCGHDGRQSRDVQKVRQFGESSATSGMVRRARYG